MAKILALTERVLVDLAGAKARASSEKFQGITSDGTLTDLGLVVYNDIEFYATLFVPNEEEDEDNRD